MGRLKRVNRKRRKEKFVLTNLKNQKMNLKDFSIVKNLEFDRSNTFINNPITPKPLLFTPTKHNYQIFLEKELKTPISKMLQSNVKSKEYQTPDHKIHFNNESGKKNLMDSNIKNLLSKPILNSLEKVLFSNGKKKVNYETSPISNTKKVPIFKTNSPPPIKTNSLNFQNVPYLPIRKSNCNCKNSKCLKLYCDCFRNQRLCQDLCNCQGCGNKNKNKDRKNAIDTVIKKNPKAFDVKFETNKITVKNRDDLQENISYRVNFVYTKGCNCKNSQCQKRYCDCFQFGLACSNKCKCINCLNGNQNNDNKEEGKINGSVIIRQSVINIKTELKEKLIKIKQKKFPNQKNL